MTAAELDKARRIAADALTGLDGELRRLGALRSNLSALVDELATLAGEAAVAALPSTPPAKPAGFDTELRVPGERRILRLGDVVAVKPSRPKKRDGWRGVITRLDAGRGEVTVTKPGECARTVAVARIGARKAAPTQEPAR